MSPVRVGVTAATLAIYLALPTRNYFWDGVAFAQTIEYAADWRVLFHANHLVYNVLGWAAYQATHGTVRALYLLQAIDSVFGALAVYLLFGLAARITRSERAALLLTALFALSGTWWRFATGAAAYVPCVALLMLSATLLVPAQRPRPVMVALAHVGAILIHQMGALFYPAAVYALWNQLPDASRTERLRRVLVYTLLAVGLPIAAYALAFAAQQPITRYSGTLMTWTTSYATNAGFRLSLGRSFLQSLESWPRVFVAGRPALVRYSEPVNILLLALCAGVVVLLALQLRRRLPLRFAVHQPIWARFGIIWFATYFVFLLSWQPHNTYYNLFALPAVIILAASCWPPGVDPLWRGRAALLVTLMALVNLTFAIIPYARFSAHPGINFAVQLRQRLPEGAIVFYGEFSTDDWFARYFNPQTSWREAVEPKEIDAELIRGKSVWLETGLMDVFAKSAPQWLAERTTGTERYELLSTGHRIRFVRLVLPAGPR